MSDLFAAAGLSNGTRAAARRPAAAATLAEVAGQDHLVGPDGALTRLLGGGSLGSLIFWGPPGTGKTTVARLLARETKLDLRAGLGDLLRRRRTQEAVRGGPRPAAGRAGHAAVRRRDPPLQPRPAGQLPARDGGRHHHADRRHDRKPVLRAQCGAAVARARAGVPGARRRRRSTSCSARAEARRGQAAAARRRTRATRWSAWRTATAARC